MKRCRKLLRLVLQKEWLMWIITIIVLFAFTIILHKQVLGVSYLHAEDGKYFVSDFFENGWGSLFYLQGGYFVVLSRLIAGIAVSIGGMFGSVLLVSDTIEILSTLFLAVTFAWFVSNSFQDIIPRRRWRLVIAILSIALIGNFYAILYNGVGIHWVCGVLVFLVGLKLLNKKLPEWYMMPLVLISILSSASAIVIGFAIVYYLWVVLDLKHLKKIRNNFKKVKIIDMVKIGLLILCLLAQVCAILFLGKTTEATSNVITLRGLGEVVVGSFELTFSSMPFLFGKAFYVGMVTMGTKVVTLCGVIMWLSVMGFAIKFKKVKYVIFAFLAMFSVHFMTLFKGVTTTQVEDIMCNPVNFYHVFAAVTCLIIVAIVFYDCYTKKQYAFLMFGAMLLILAFYCADLEDIDLKPNKQLEAVETYIEYGSENYAEVPITPYGEWTVKVPVKIEYCEEHKCVSR